MPSPQPASVAAARPGTSYPLGATYDGAGTNSSLLSELADRGELCLISKDSREQRIGIEEADGNVGRPRSVVALRKIA